MLAHQKITNSDNFFQNLSQRSPRGVYFCRINGWNPEINTLIRKYYDAAKRTGVVIEGGIPNPTNQNLAYYQEMMGSQFQMNETFIQLSLRKWLPRMNPGQCDSVAGSIYHTLDRLRQSGKPESILKNIYIKFMCWLYYKFERILGQLGTEQLPKILYEGEISYHALLLISVLAHAGSDVILLQYHGDQNYLKLDPRSEFSEIFDLPGMTPFPQNFSLEQIRQELNQELNRKRLYGTLPEILNCTNAWLSGNDSVFAEIRKNPTQRGQDRDFFYNCYCRVSGVEEKQSYPNQLYRFYTDLKNAGRNVVILDQSPAQPDANEVSAIQRKNNYTRLEDMIQDLLSLIPICRCRRLVECRSR
ncbi:MAG: YceG family protein, partial [Oscillospiraceae bacterium]|nr:YceG family protein [Oscillospiraceae bacterium]